jgi:transcriptional regulator with XRE-family HTH domain
MSQLVVTPHTVVDKIPLGRRIHEIMKEKGGYYSITAMSKRLGICRETYRLMLNGEREIYTFELEKIAKDLKVPVERILQEDIQKDAEVLKMLLEKSSDPPKALEVAFMLEQKACGLSERCIALHRLGHAHFLLHQYEDSHTNLLAAHQLALKMNEMYGETDWLYRILFNLLDTFTARRDYVNASRILQEVDPIFHRTPSRSAALNYLHAKMKESLGDIEGAKNLAYESIKYAELSGKENLIGKTAINAAHYEFLTKNYQRSKELLVNAMKNLADDVRTLLIARKEFVKTLIKLEEHQVAEQEITSAIEIAKHSRLSEMEGKLLILLARAKNEPFHAEFVVSEERFGKKIRYLACKFLTQYYRHKGDSYHLMQYHKIMEELHPTNSDILDEGEL